MPPRPRRSAADCDDAAIKAATIASPMRPGKTEKRRSLAAAPTAATASLANPQSDRRFAAYPQVPRAR